MPGTNKINFVDLAQQQARIINNLEIAIRKVLSHGCYISGPEVSQLEKELSEFTGAEHVITCSSGTDALLMVLMAIGLNKGHAVFVPSFTFVASVEMAALLGATPVFVDVEPDTFLMDATSLCNAISLSRKLGLTPRVIIPVDLFGQPVDYDLINSIAEEENLFVLADAAQSFGASLHENYTGTLAHATATSFFPAKPLGCYGDGGAVFTDDEELAQLLNSIRVHGKGNNKYDNVRVGINGRLDTLQAAILIEKLKIFDDEIIDRQRVAGTYTQSLSGHVKTPVVSKGRTSIWAQYTIQSPCRDLIADNLKRHGIPTNIYYPIPLHLADGYKDLPRTNTNLPVSEALAKTVLSLPMHPYLTSSDQNRIIELIIKVTTA